MKNDRLLQFIREVVIDGKERFKKKKKDDFAAKLRSAEASINDAFSTQENNEKVVNKMLKEIVGIPERFMSRKALRLACPAIYDEDKGWGSNMPVFRIISLADMQDELERKQLTAFIKANAAAAKESIEVILDKMSSIKSSAEALEWPASDWMKYTRWSNYVHDVQHYISKIKLMLDE